MPPGRRGSDGGSEGGPKTDGGGDDRLGTSVPDIDDLVGARDDAEITLDLAGHSVEAALAVLDRLPELSEEPGVSVAIRFPKAVPGAGETLFIPVGRKLLDLRRAGILSRLDTLPDGAGFRAVVGVRPWRYGA